LRIRLPYLAGVISRIVNGHPQSRLDELQPNGLRRCSRQFAARRSASIRTPSIAF
jgi:hypothetical protein